MLTGRDALFSVERAISSVRADESRLDQALRSATAEAARLMQEEAEGFRALARARLDAMASNQIVGDLDGAERRALAMIEDHRRALEELARRRDQAQQALERAEAEQHERDEELARALRALDELRDRTARRMASDADWRAAKSALDAAESVAANADKKAATAEADMAEKRKPYESDPLFMYLWRKKHDQSEDRSGFFVRFIDRRIARLVGYRDARANYAMLQEIPARLREHAAAKQADVEAAKDRLAAVERRALVADGVEALEQAAAAAQAAAKAAEEAVAKNTAALRDIEERRRQATGPGGDAAYDQAVELLTKALTREDLRQLYEEAARTPPPADDQAVAAIAAARKALQKTNDEIARIREQIRETAQRRAELEGARDRARRQGYDSPMGTFGDQVDVGAVIGGILKGAIRGGALDDVFRNGYRFPPPRSNPDFGRRRSDAPSFPIPWGGGDSGSGGGFSGGGGGGGGWRTGGSF